MQHPFILKNLNTPFDKRPSNSGQFVILKEKYKFENKILNNYLP